MSRGDRSPDHIVALRKKKVSALALQGLKASPIAAKLGMTDKIRTIFRDLRDLDLAAAADIESVELRKKLRTNRIAALKELERVVAESDQLNDAERIQASLAITDRYIRLGLLDDASLLPGRGSAGDAPVTVVLNVDFEGPEHAINSVPAPLALPPSPVEPTPEPTPEPVAAEERELSTEECLREIERIKNGPVDPMESVAAANEELHAAGLREFAKFQQGKK